MSTIVTDTITGKSTATTITIGSTPVVSASANSMTIRGEGSNQTSIQQGLLKAWINFNGTGTISTEDSFNRSGLTDNGTGDYTFSFTNNMANTSYCFTGGLSSTSDRGILILNNGVDLSASAFTFQTIKDNDLKIDCTVVTVQIAGDLA
mgnify:CR=1 FL=1